MLSEGSRGSWKRRLGRIGTIRALRQDEKVMLGSPGWDLEVDIPLPLRGFFFVFSWSVSPGLGEWAGPVTLESLQGLRDLT